MKKIAALIFILFMVLFSISGCSSIGEKVGEKVGEKIAEKVIEEAAGSDGADVDVDLSKEGATIKTDEGEVNIGKGASLPDGFPSEVPINPGLQIVTSWKSTDDGKESFAVTALYKGSGDEIFNWYKDKLASSGWESTGEFTMDSGDEGKTSSLGASNGKYDISITIAEAEGGVSVIIGVNEK